MNVVSWIKGIFSTHGSAISLYRRGMAKAKKRDPMGAIEDYTASIDSQDVPADVKAMALYNRALVYAADGQTAKAIHDLNVVLEMRESLPTIKTEARRKLLRMKRSSEKSSS